MMKTGRKRLQTGLGKTKMPSKSRASPRSRLRFPAQQMARQQARAVAAVAEIQARVEGTVADGSARLRDESW